MHGLHDADAPLWLGDSMADAQGRLWFDTINAGGESRTQYFLPRVEKSIGFPTLDPPRCAQSATQLIIVPIETHRAPNNACTCRVSSNQAVGASRRVKAAARPKRNPNSAAR